MGSNTKNIRSSKDNYAIGQSLDITSQLLMDTLHYLYDMNNVETIWGSTADNRPAIQYEFPNTPANIANNEKFIENLKKTKSTVRCTIDVQHRIIAFEDLNSVPEFITAFMVQNDLLPDVTNVENTPSVRKHDFISYKDLLTLKEPFYTSVEHCMKRADEALKPPFKDTALFVYSLADLQKSITLAMNIANQNTTHTTDSVLHFH